MASQIQGRQAGADGVGRTTDVRVVGTDLRLLPVNTRVPLKFGTETLTSVTCARVQVQISDRSGRVAEGWGETPLSVQWAWPAAEEYAARYETMVAFCRRLAQAWASFDQWGHPLEIGHAFLNHSLPAEQSAINSQIAPAPPIPLLASLICCSPFDIALHDAYGNLLGVPVYDTYDAHYMNRDLSTYLTPADGSSVDFRGKYPADFFVRQCPDSLPAWHLVGGLDPLQAGDSPADDPGDGHPVLLGDWIERDGLTCLKIKLRGTDAPWDYQRLVEVGKIALDRNVHSLSADFNCTVTDPAYVNDVLDRLAETHPRIYELLLYVEQPFPYDLEAHKIDVHSVSSRKPLLMDESAHDWQVVRLGRELGWTGVALKTCKTQTGALLSLCWAKAHGMHLMVQDLTNPMLAQIPHVLLAAHAGTMMGVETNAMQFYPEASAAEATVHPGLFARREGSIDLSSIRGPGFGYRVHEIDRQLPAPVVTCRDGNAADFSSASSA